MSSSDALDYRPARTALLACLIPVLAVDVWCGARILKLVGQQSVVKEDYAEVNSIRNGLLSVSVWKAHLGNIASRKITHFDLTAEQEEAVRSAVEKALNALIAETDKLMRQPQKTIRGKVRKMAFKVFVDTESLTAKTPEYADAVIREVRKPANLEKLKNLALSQIAGDPNSNNTEAELSLKALLERYGAKSTEEFNRRADGLIHDSRKEIRIYISVMIGSLFLFLLVWWCLRARQEIYRPLYTLSVALAFIVLVSALALPMIDIDARIRHVDFLLMGDHMQFTNQLLFYRSKSIMQMVRILLIGGKPNTILVGGLIFLFSIAFPVMKLSSTLCVLYGGEKLQNHPWVHFFAYESGKWSMADVMVVAIFMAYIGFNSVLNGQLKNLNFQSSSTGVITTNETALQPGFPLFVSFVLFSLVLSAILKNIVRIRK